MDSAIQAKSASPGSRIDLVDSESASLTMGFQVMTAARMASSGATLTERCAVAENANPHSGVLFLADTLEFLPRDGRMSGAVGLLGY